jgi:hypothetical protein
VLLRPSARIICEDNVPAAAAAGDEKIVFLLVLRLPWAKRTTQLDVGARMEGPVHLVFIFSYSHIPVGLLLLDLHP